MKHNRLTRLLAVLLAAVLLAGCGKGKKTEDAEKTGDPNTLTHVWRGSALPMPEGLTISGSVQPVWDPERGVLTCAALRGEQVNDEEGYYDYDIVHATLVETSPDGVLSERPGILPDGNLTGFFRENRFFWLSQEVTENSYRVMLQSVDLDTGETTAGDDLVPLFSEPGVLYYTFAVDGDGDFWFTNGREIIAVTPAWTRRASIPVRSGDAQDILTSRDGRVWIAAAGNGRGITVSSADKETGTLRPAITNQTATRVMEGNGEWLFFFADHEGVKGVREENGNLVMEEVVNYDNSAMDYHTITPVALFDGDVMLAVRYDPNTGFIHGIVPAEALFCTRAEDIDISRLKTITVAYTDTLSPAMTAAVNRFREEHVDFRVELEDWTDKGTPGTWGGGAARMTQDIVTGLYKPDILYSATSNTEGSDTAVYIQQAYAKGLYVDLLPYLEADGLADDLFGSVRRTFDDGEGGIWGLASHVMIDEVFVSTPELLGPYAEKGYWNLAEFLDFIETRPEGTEAYNHLTQTTLPSFCEGAFRGFIDLETGTCSFDSPVFVRYLELLRSLPTETDYERHSPYVSLDGNELAELRFAGKLALSRTKKLVFGQTLAIYYGMKDPVLIGNPSPDERRGAGMELVLRDVCVILDTCKERDAAWALLRSLFDADSLNGAPALHSGFREAAEELYAREYVSYFDRSAPSYSHILWDDMKPTDPAALPHPGVVTRFTPEDTARMEEVFENAGSPLAERWNNAAVKIVREEISAFLGGVGTAEECAGKIQSRASIYLAEQH